MRTERIRTIEDIDKAIANLDRQMDRIEFSISRDMDILLDIPTQLKNIFNVVTQLFRKK